MNQEPSAHTRTLRQLELPARLLEHMAASLAAGRPTWNGTTATDATCSKPAGESRSSGNAHCASGANSEPP